jgi:hypothetical protein
MIVARHEVPGRRPPQNRPVGYGMIQAQIIPEASWLKRPTECPMTFKLLFDVMDRLLNHTVSPVFTSETSSLRSSNRGAHTCKNQTVPYGTALWVGDGPDTSCQAMIAPSLRDKIIRPSDASH